MARGYGASGSVRVTAEVGVWVGAATKMLMKTVL